MKKQYLIRTFEKNEVGTYNEQKHVKIITGDLGSELEKLVNDDTRMVKVKVTRQYADELEV